MWTSLSDMRLAWNVGTPSRIKPNSITVLAGVSKHQHLRSSSKQECSAAAYSGKMELAVVRPDWKPEFVGSRISKCAKSRFMRSQMIEVKTLRKTSTSAKGR